MAPTSGAEPSIVTTASADSAVLNTAVSDAPGRMPSTQFAGSDQSPSPAACHSRSAAHTAYDVNPAIMTLTHRFMISEPLVY